MHRWEGDTSICRLDRTGETPAGRFRMRFGRSSGVDRSRHRRQQPACQEKSNKLGEISKSGPDSVPPAPHVEPGHGRTLPPSGRKRIRRPHFRPSGPVAGFGRLAGFGCPANVRMAVCGLTQPARCRPAIPVVAPVADRRWIRSSSRLPIRRSILCWSGSGRSKSGGTRWPMSAGWPSPGGSCVALPASGRPGRESWTTGRWTT